MADQDTLKLEGAKLTANLANGVAVAFFVGALVAPMIDSLEFDPAKSVALFAFGVFCHALSRAILWSEMVVYQNG